MHTNKKKFINQLLKKGIELHKSGALAEAWNFYVQVIKIDEENFDALQLCAAILIQQSSFQEAIPLLEAAIKINGHNTDVLNNYGVALQKTKRFEEAHEKFDSALNINSSYLCAIYNKADTFQEQNKYEESIVYYNQVLEYVSNHADAHNNKGVSLLHLNQQRQAINCFEKAIQANKNHIPAYQNRGVALEALRQYKEAELSYSKALEISPENEDIKWNLALVKLRQKKLTAGFDLYRARWGSNSFTSRRMVTKIPYWDGGETPQKILLWPEQGIGDEIFYARMLSHINLKKHRVTLAADKRLVDLISRSFPKVQVIENLPHILESDCFSAQAPVGDLGFLLGISEKDIPQLERPYLTPNLERVEKILNDYPMLRGSVVCGISWKSLHKDHGEEKSVCLEDLLPLFRLKNVRFLSLQYGEISDEIIRLVRKFNIELIEIDKMDLFNDIDGLLALISICKVVISTSNVTAHLAGAIGKRSAVLVPYSKGKIWYWHDGDSSSMWYPSLSLFHAEKPKNFRKPIQQIRNWLSKNLSDNVR